MLKHYLKIAFRNLWKYKTQSLISIIGLAIGFTCFALSMLWIRYERTYDNFHEGADRLYLVRNESDTDNSGVSKATPYPLASYLKETFPEIEDACNTRSHKGKIEVDGITHELFQAQADSSFMRMFNIDVVAGNLNFLIPNSKNVAITEELSKTLFKNDDPLGKMITIYREEYTICAIVRGWTRHSNFYFQLLVPNNPIPVWYASYLSTLVKIKEGTDVAAFSKKIYEHKIEREHIVFTNILIASLTSLRYNNPENEAEIEYRYILLFTLAGGLVILCSLFNYLTLFVSRFRIRIRELALRIVNGASGALLFTLLSVELIITLIISLVLGLFFIRLSIVPFTQLSNVYMDISNLYGESLIYIVAIILLSLFIFLAIITIFRLQSLQASIIRIRNNVFRKVSVILQLIISIGFIFCTIVIMKQIYFLRHTDIGFDYKNTTYIYLYPEVDINEFENQLRQIPEIAETLTKHNSIIPNGISMRSTLTEWEDMPLVNDESRHMIGIIPTSESYMNFYNFRLAEGEFLNDHSSSENIMINEAAVKLLGWNQPVGKTLKLTHDSVTMTVKGIIKDFYIEAPTIPPTPAMFRYNYISPFGGARISNILIKYHDGLWENCKTKIEQLAKQEYPNATLNIINAEETYNDYMKSEAALLKLLGFVSFVCIIISIFGLFSLISLTCEERRKEIAIRKINGASVQNILTMYLKEYSLLLAIGAIIAFPTGYIIMKSWIENYVKQTTISALIYLSILLVLGVIIILCVGWRVYKTSRENPAEVVKSE